MNAPTPEAGIRHELAAIKSYLTAARDVVKSGHMPELAGLENRIARLCESIQKATPDIQKTCLPELFILTDYLNACETEMRKLHTAKNPESEKA